MARTLHALLCLTTLLLLLLTSCADDAGNEAAAPGPDLEGDAGTVRMVASFPTPVQLDPATGTVTTRAVPVAITRLLLQITEGDPRQIIPPGSPAFTPCANVVDGGFCDILPAIQDSSFTFTLADSPLVRHFRLEAFEAGQAVPTFVGRATAVIQGDTTLTIQMRQDILIALNPGTQDDQEGAAPSLDIGLSNPTGEAPTFSAVGLPPNLTIDSTTGQITGSLASTADDGSPYNVTITVSTSTDSDSVTFIWTVNNPAPVAQDDMATTLEDTAVEIDVVANDADPDNDTLTITAVTQGANGTVVITSGDTVSYTPNEDFNGMDTFTYTLLDADGGTDTATVTVDITPVNDAPSFISGPSQFSVFEDDGPQTVVGWAFDLSPVPLLRPVPPDEAGQTLSFVITTNSNPGLFAAGPAISPTGTLTYTPAPDAHGMATLMVVLQDDGGTANGGVDTSVAHSFTITVTSVNDAPSFTAGPAQSVLEDAGPQSVPAWATAISPGPVDEAGQTVNFAISMNSNPGLFAAGPAISPTGTLTYTPAPDAHGMATLMVVLQDDGGTANGGVDTSVAQPFTITVVPAAIVEGSVLHFVSRAPIESADLVFLDNNQETVGETQTGSNGVYTLALPVGPVMGIASRDGFIPTTVDLEVIDDQITTVEVILLVPDTGSPTGDIGGTIRDAITNEGVPDVLVELRSGVNNTTDEIISSTMTNAVGEYSFADIQAGTYTASVSADGFFPNRFTVGVVGGDAIDGQDGTISPQLNPGEVRILLTWGPTPEDLDSHLTGPRPSGMSENQTCATDTSERFHLYYPCANSDTGSPFPDDFTLDLDDTDGSGPETVTILSSIEGTYRYCVHDFTNRGNTMDSRALSNSGAQVRVFIGEPDGLRSESFNIPPDMPGTVWRVFELDGQTLDIMALDQFEFESNEADVCNGL